MKNKFKALFTLIVVLTLATMMFLTGCAALPSADQSAPSGTGAASSETALAREVEPEATLAAQMSYVSIDINPSIELTLLGGIVVGAKAYNDDGAAIILTNDVVGMTPEASVSALVNSFASEGFIKEGEEKSAIVITVAGGQDEGLAESLKQNAEQSLQSLGLEGNVVTTSVAGEIVQTAENCGLSVGRYLLLKQVALQQKISLEEAIEKYGSLKMNDLLKMIEDIDEFMGDIDRLNSALDSLTPEQLQMLTQARSAFQARMRAVQQEFLAARTQAKDAFKTAREGAKDSFLASKDKSALKASKQQIKDAFALAKKTATNNLKQAKIQARVEFMAAVAGFGLDQETIDKLIEWEFVTDFEVNMDFEFENEAVDESKDEDKENVEDKKDQEKSSNKDEGGQGKGKGNS